MTRKSGYYWPERGLRIEFERDKINHLVYFAPFDETICGIWIGAHAWEVNEILGRPKAEFPRSPGRLWQYDIEGFMSVGFDVQDRVRSIGR